LVLLGLTLGVLAGYVLIRLFASQYFANSVWQQMTGQLYGVKPSDPFTLVIIALLLTLIALLACWIPARRATKVDPLVALRYE
jgi:ABC-type antimicrobial peptide transport system permease subunit